MDFSGTVAFEVTIQEPVAGGWWLVTGGWWLVAGDDRRCRMIAF
jgi:hypothetical protein